MNFLKAALQNQLEHQVTFGRLQKKLLEKPKAKGRQIIGRNTDFFGATLNVKEVKPATASTSLPQRKSIRGFRADLFKPALPQTLKTAIGGERCMTEMPTQQQKKDKCVQSLKQQRIQTPCINFKTEPEQRVIKNKEAVSGKQEDSFEVEEEHFMESKYANNEDAVQTLKATQLNERSQMNLPMRTSVNASESAKQFLNSRPSLEGRPSLERRLSNMRNSTSKFPARVSAFNNGLMQSTEQSPISSNQKHTFSQQMMQSKASAYIASRRYTDSSDLLDVLEEIPSKPHNKAETCESFRESINYIQSFLSTLNRDAFKSNLSGEKQSEDELQTDTVKVLQRLAERVQRCSRLSSKQTADLLVSIKPTVNTDAKQESRFQTPKSSVRMESAKLSSRFSSFLDRLPVALSRHQRRMLMGHISRVEVLANQTNEEFNATIQRLSRLSNKSKQAKQIDASAEKKVNIANPPTKIDAANKGLARTTRKKKLHDDPKVEPTPQPERSTQKLFAATKTSIRQQRYPFMTKKSMTIGEKAYYMKNRKGSNCQSNWTREQDIPLIESILKDCTNSTCSLAFVDNIKLIEAVKAERQNLNWQLDDDSILSGRMKAKRAQKLCEEDLQKYYCSFRIEKVEQQTRHKVASSTHIEDDLMQSALPQNGELKMLHEQSACKPSHDEDCDASGVGRSKLRRLLLRIRQTSPSSYRKLYIHNNVSIHDVPNE